jgi:hypothetical protein
LHGHAVIVEPALEIGGDGLLDGELVIIGLEETVVKVTICPVDVGLKGHGMLPVVTTEYIVA